MSRLAPARLAAVLTALAVSLPAPLAAQDAAAPAATLALPAITVTPVAEATLRDRVIASGTFRPAETAFVQPEVEGQAVQEVLADVGDRVVAGQVLARLSQSALELQRSQFLASRAAAIAAIAQASAQVAEATAARDEALRTATRTRALRAQGNAPQATLEQAEAALATAEARVLAATEARASAEAQIGLIDAQIANVDLNLGRTGIAAPVAGVILARSAQIGSIASAAGGPMFTIIRDGALELHADVTETDMLRLVPGQPVTLRALGQPLPVTGTVRLVDPTVDSATRLGRIRIAVDDSSLVRDGMFAEAEVLIAERTALAAPVTAIAADGSALRVTDGQVARVPVRTGIRDGALVEIVDGLAAGDLLVARAGAFVRPGDRINPIPADAPVASN
ncbi:MAG: efflux RND transporter periplasmic adaptor subunit [Rhodobacteraceae bacterium]|nr:efflux RND transporter periplasmic adaptor subunit [Paracoccaceae bacterium]